jgi:hypothetical protein
MGLKSHPAKKKAPPNLSEPMKEISLLGTAIINVSEDACPAFSSLFNPF